MGTVTRRGFVGAAASAVATVALAQTSCSGQTHPTVEPIVEADSGFGYRTVTHAGDPRLTYSPDSGLAIITVDGSPFKDLNGNGELDPFEDWRLAPEERARDLAGRLALEQCAGLMCFSSHQRSIADKGLLPEQETLVDAGVRSVLSLLWGYPAHRQAAWANLMQARAEAQPPRIPVCLATDPRDGRNCTDWPSSLALAAAADPDLAREVGRATAEELRTLGISCYLGPKLDAATDPRWQRFFTSFGEDPALGRDVARAFVDGMQSTLDEAGADVGWGAGSVACMVKRWCGEGAGEGGREGHMDGGKYAVYPSDGFDLRLIPFVDGAFKLEGKTGRAAETMCSYTIAFDEDERYGELVGSGFSDYKVSELLRGRYGFDGAVCTDWYVLNDVGTGGEDAWRCWGLEDPAQWNPARRAAKAIAAGVDQMGGLDDPQVLLDAHEILAGKWGAEAADERFRQAAERILTSSFQVGLFEDPYVDVDAARERIDKGGAAVREAALAAQVGGIVLLKNDGVLGPGGSLAATGRERLRAYVPLRVTEACRMAGEADVYPWVDQPATCELPAARGMLDRYFDVVSDPEPPAGEKDLTAEDVERLSAEGVAGCDVVLVFAKPPANASALAGRDELGAYVPLSLQYRPYVADGEYVRRTSLAGDARVDGTRENRSYFSASSQVTNEAQLDQILAAAAVAHEAGKPCVVVLDTKRPCCVHEFEREVDAIVLSLSGSDEAACRVVTGAEEPSGLLPFQMPASMEAVEKQLEDAPRDMDCYVDAAGHTYDFMYGLNWSGVIEDVRTQTYGAEPLREPEQ